MTADGILKPPPRMERCTLKNDPLMRQRIAARICPRIFAKETSLWTENDKIDVKNALNAAESIEELFTQDSTLNTQHGGDHYKKLGNYQPWLVLKKLFTHCKHYWS